ncbi:FAD-dependent oxidoreductase, partial [Kingella kingae]|uniref:FAD-dependent oxidoreductase n=1 Tax=Kingella kingae TaxID=504 RepID=UPI0020A70BD0
TPPAADCRDPSSLHILIIGAGIAGATTAYECAIRGAKVTVLEAQSQVAQAGSGNRQGLLYAKISPHATEQTELLLSGYGYTRYVLRQ